MTKCALLLLLVLLPPAWGQDYLNKELSLMVGPSFGSTQAIDGTNITVNGGTGSSTTFGFAFQVMQQSAVTLWVEPFPVITEQPGESTSTPGFNSADSLYFVPSVRLMAPVHPRISLFAALGGGIGYFHNYTLAIPDSSRLNIDETYHGIFSGGGGVDFRVSKHFSLRIDARDYITGRNLGGVAGRNHPLPMAGVAYRF